MPRACAAQMATKRWFIASGLAFAAIVFVALRPAKTQLATEPRASTVLESSPICPWREPQRDLAMLFPTATNVALESRIISGVMVPVQKRLGRALNPDENPLRLHRPQGPHGSLGSLLVTRVKGEHGGVELVIGTDTNRAVVGVIVQSLREPHGIARAITNSEWLAAFSRKTAQSALMPGNDLPAMPAAARATAQAIADGVRDKLVVLEFAELPVETREHGKHTDVHIHH